VMDSDLARLSNLIYEKPESFGDEITYLGWRLFHWFEDRGSQAAIVIADNGSCAALVFRGTQVTNGKLHQRLIDLKTNLKMWRRGAFHAGYHQAVSWLSIQAHSRVPRNIPLYITGHSLGGAMATVYACQAEHPITALVTFGAPKAIIDPAFLGFKEIRRYRLSFDPFTMWPPNPNLTHPAPAIPLNSHIGHSTWNYIHALSDQRAARAA
jgi:triacylglycerol lipase